MANIPNIRFKGFADDWEQRKLLEIADKVTEKNKNNEISEPFTNSAELGIISQKDYFDREVVNQENLDGYYIVRNDDFVYNPRISVTAPVGPINRNRLDRNGVMSPLYTVFRTHGIDNLYLEFYFKTTSWHRFMKLNGDSGARFDRFTISSTQFMEMPIPFPNKEEQRKIGGYFDVLDHFITLHQRKCDEVRQLKKFMFQKMFPQNGELIPEIRFAGFTGDWEQRKFGTMFKRRMERNNGQFDNTRWISVAKMYFQEPDKVTSNNIDTRTYVMRRGDIAFEGHSNAEYKYGRFVANDIGDGIISELFPIYMHIDDYDEAYWKYAIQIEEIMASKLLKCIEISYTSSNKLDEDFFLKEEILVPSLDEQQQIGTYFRNLDHLITLHQHKCDQLKEVKRFMLQNMFPQKG